VAPPDPNDLEPDVAKFTDYVEWQKNWIRWNSRQDQRQQRAVAIDQGNRQQAKTRADTWQSRVDAAKAELPDFEAVAQRPDLAVTSTMGEAIVDSEISTKILYYLGQNPKEAERIAKLSPGSQVREIGKIEGTLSSAAADDDAGDDAEEPLTKEPVVSKAPAPHKPIGGRGGSVNPAKQLDTMTQSEYRAYRDSGKIR
jgi:hypothetical protein